MHPNASDRRTLLKAAAALTLGWPLASWAQAARGGVLVIGTTQKPRHLNSAVQSGIATMFPSAQLFASPLRMSADWKPQPYLAEKFELSSDNRSVALTLRRDAVFHDGRPITAEDIKFSIETIRDHHPFRSMYAPVNAVTLEGPLKAVVRLAEPHPALLLAMSTSLTPIIPRHIFGDGTDPKVHPRNANPVGSGPFKLVEFKPGEHIVMERHQRFFLKDLPRLERLIVKEYKDPASLLLAFEKGEIDVHPLIGDPRDLERARKIPNVQLVSGAQPAVGPLLWLAFNTKNPKLADKRVRQAISYAIDRKFIAGTLFGGLHKVATGPIALGSPYYSAEVQPYAHDPAKAAQLLDAAGLKPGAGGTRLALEVDSIPGSNELKMIQEYLKPALAKVGIDVTVRLSPDFPTWARRVSAHQFEMTMDSVWNWGDPVIGVHRTWLTSNIKPGVIWSNTQSYSNPRVDQLLEAAAKEMDVPKRKAMYKEVQKLVVDDCPVAFLLEATITEGYAAKVAQPPRGIWGMIDSMSEVGLKKA
ncbi:MAG: ABC transporter substrate-binding protein [Betaproteobacteria bacterium]|nr:ABC transporter substrate-binding protein [Betaproteobacteria bacterium]